MFKSLVKYFVFLFFPGRCTGCASSRIAVQREEIHAAYTFCLNCGSIQDFMNQSVWWSQSYGASLWDRFELINLEQSINQNLIL